MSYSLGRIMFVYILVHTASSLILPVSGFSAMLRLLPIFTNAIYAWSLQFFFFFRGSHDSTRLDHTIVQRGVTLPTYRSTVYTCTRM